MIKLSKDGRCQFDTQWNSFQMIDSRKRLRSWSKIIKQYIEPVDSNEIATKYAAKHGETPEHWIAVWRAKADRSTALGTAVHSIFDQYIQSGQIPATVGPDNREAVAIKFIKDFFETGRLEPIESEAIAYSEEYNCATLIDCIAKNQFGQKFIIDWKTDEVIEDNNYGRYMKPPFGMLPEHDLQKHKLQLNWVY